MTRKRTSEPYTNSIEPPTYQSASYYFDDADQVKAGLHDLSIPAGRYGRYSNPTWVEVEARLSELSEAESSLLFASGMAAHFTTFVSLLEAGDEVVLPAESYRQVRNVFHHILPKFGIVVHEISIRDPEAFLDGIAALSGRLKLVHLEMPSSPHMYLIDVARIRQIVGDDVVITLDSSFSPPPNFYALRWGVDLVLFSATKYLGGHGDIVAGVLSGRRDLVERIRWYRDTTGPVADGNVAFLLRRSLYTLALRMERVNAQGLEVARFLTAHPRVRRVFYTGLETHPHFKLGQDYLHGHGGVVTFELGLGETETAEIVDRLEVPFMASNFGAPHTLVEQSTFFTYFEYDDAALKSIGVDRSTIRLALGYANESTQVVEDLDRALTGG
ncbi:PLP-dependent transferase [Actinomadura sp. DC4]|uniref:PLP-dependent transferase n=1 Tax=Actinomadura sp. DC4 TaxID=3055069 RepID=UPI0025B056B0|nr:PLP-dependent transferase [Actinomadura sp. DC4]MDN3353817.1 aminotransferase class V-fold PLP-dependent enzyme [Actinomadura sp. DC4]